MRPLDAFDARLGRALARLERTVMLHAAAAALVLLAVLVRLPLVFRATDVVDGHNDTWTYFIQVTVFYLDGNFYPDHDRGSGWSLLLYVVLRTFGVEPLAWFEKGAALDAAQAHAALLAYALSALLMAGATAATFLLARQALRPAAALGATLLVALDPYLLGISTSAMSEPAYVTLFVLALACVLKARAHPAWLLPAALLMAGAHVLRVNGLVMFGMVLLFAWLLLRDLPRRTRLAWSAGAVALFLVVLSPYLAWREAEGPGAFDYGTNQRFFADDLWDSSDHYWTTRQATGEGERETLIDYARTHTLAEALGRLYRSVQWQVFDLVGAGRWPVGEPQGGEWPGSVPEGAALTPLLVALGLVGAFTALHRRELWFVPLAVGVTLLTFVWIYPLVRSVRYFSPLVPLVAVLAMAGWAHLAGRARRPRVVGLALFGGYVLLHAGRALLAVPEGVAGLAREPDVLALTAWLTAAWVLLVLAPLAWPWLARALRATGRVLPARE